MRKRFNIVLMAVALSLAGTWAGLYTAAQAGELPVPDAPLLMASGESVQIAWTLPRGPRVDTVAVYRTSDDADGYVEVGRVPASDLTLTDDGVRLGQTCYYRIRTLRGTLQSGFSEQAGVTVGDMARILFHGGSPGRAVFEVVLIHRGERVSRRFVHGPGEEIGDLAYVRKLEETVDFRLGLTLVEMKLGRASVTQTQREPLKDREGNPITGPGGEAIELDFHIPGESREVLTATLEDQQGRQHKLHEGETWRAGSE